MRKAITVLLAMALLVCVVIPNVFAGGKKDTTPVGSGPLAGKRIGVVHITLYDEWCKGVYDDFLRISKEYGVREINIQNGDLNLELQVRQVEDFITQRYDIIFVDPMDPLGIRPVLDRANAAGIPVIAFDGSVDEWPPLVSYIAWDNAETGRLTGQFAVDYAKQNLGGKLRVGLLTMLHNPMLVSRSEAFKQTIEAGLGRANVEYVFEQDFGQTRESAANIVTNNIARPIDIIWGAVDNASMGARNALQTARVTTTKVISAGGWGTEPFTALASKDPHYAAFVGVPPEGIVRMTLETAARYFSGDKNIPKRQDIDLKIIDQNNIDEYRPYF